MNKGGSVCSGYDAPPLTRREMLQKSSAGFGALALAGLLGEEARAAATDNPLASRQPHFQAKAKRIIFLFMHGGVSQVDSFDYRPALQRDTGKPYPGKKPRIVSSATGNLVASPYSFKQYGQCGQWASDIFPHIASMSDDLCFIKSIYGSNSRHGSALLELHTGSDTFIRPSMGSWLNYGLGFENQNLPGYITFKPTGTHGGMNAWSSAFLPAHYHGVQIGTNATPIDKAKIPFIDRNGKPLSSQRRELDLLAQINREHLSERGHDNKLEARINSFELAFRMQAAAPEIQNIDNETEATKKLYGLDDPKTRDFGRQCLMARRYSEAGVRFVQCSQGYWDAHGGLKNNHRDVAGKVDKPIAGLIADMKARGLLEDTLILWGTEFGRTPVGQGSDGRDHNPHAMTFFLAGAGVKPGTAYGSTDDHGYYATENRVHFHDLQATILHLFGLDHKRLTYRYAGRDFRLTDVHGDVVHDILT